MRSIGWLVMLLAGCFAGLSGCELSSEPGQDPEPEQGPVTYGAIWADSPEYVVAARSDGVVVIFDGDQQREFDFGELPHRLWGTSRTALYANGTGMEHRFDGNIWTTRETAFPEERCWQIDTPSHSSPYGRCGDRKIVRRHQGELVLDYEADEDVQLSGLHGTGPDNTWVVGTRLFYDGEGDATALEPVILRNPGGGWETVVTPFSLKIPFPPPNDLEHDTYFADPSSVWVRPSGEVFISRGWFGSGVYFDGEQWHLREYSSKVMTGIPGNELYGTSPGCFMYSCNHGVSVSQQGDQWNSFKVFDNHLVGSIYALPGGLLVGLCHAQADGLFHEKCGDGLLQYHDADGTVTNYP